MCSSKMLCRFNMLQGFREEEGAMWCIVSSWLEHTLGVFHVEHSAVRAV